MHKQSECDRVKCVNDHQFPTLELERAHVTHKPIERTNKKLESYESRWLCMAGVDSHAYVHYLWLWHNFIRATHFEQL